MSKKTVGLIILLFIAAGLLLFVAMTTLRKGGSPQQPAVTPTPTPFAKTTLGFAKDGTAPNTVDVTIQTNGNMVTAVQFVVQYDPKAIQVQRVTAGDFLPNPVLFPQNIDAKTGTISFAMGISPTGDGKDGTGTVARISYIPLGKGSTTMSFTPDTLVTATGYKESVLRSTTPITFALQ